MSERFDVVLLGTGSPLPSADRCGAGNVIVAGDTHILVDCGWGAARKIIPSGIRPRVIDTALFTHLHTDHMTDFPDFLFLRWTAGAQTPLRVFGPDGTADLVEGFLLAMRRDIGFRTAHHGDKLHPDGIRVEVTELPATPGPRGFLSLSGLICESFEVDHTPAEPAFGYRFSFDGRVAVLSGDTALCESLAVAAGGADLLVCEAMNLPMMEQRIAGLKSAGMTRESGLLADVPSYHISTDEIAVLARDAGVGELVLTHIIPPITNDPAQVEAFSAGMSDVYAGPIRVARDTERVPVVKRGS
ncbi:MAG: MBL fold metallo-hydrolase [Chloroflexi bacterium]|nr:MBL fold metallo-hydrolase [Chloroflexota bacterium]